MRLLLGALAYILPTFPFGYAWHLVAFKPYYDALQIYRDDVIVPFGLVATVIQGFAWAYVYQRAFSGECGAVPSSSSPWLHLWRGASSWSRPPPSTKWPRYRSSS